MNGGAKAGVNFSGRVRGEVIGGEDGIEAVCLRGDVRCAHVWAVMRLMRTGAVVWLVRRWEAWVVCSEEFMRWQAVEGVPPPKGFSIFFEGGGR